MRPVLDGGVHPAVSRAEEPGEWARPLCRLHTPFMQCSQGRKAGLPLPSPVDHVLSELSTMTRPSWVALHSMAHSFIELDKLWPMWSDWLVFCDCGFQSVCPLMEKDKKLVEASWWERLTEGNLGLVLMGVSMLSKALIQFSVDGWVYVPSLLFDLRPNYVGDNKDSSVQFSSVTK